MLIDKKSQGQTYRFIHCFQDFRKSGKYSNLRCTAVHTLQNLCFWNCKISPTLEKRFRPFINSLHFRDSPLETRIHLVFSCGFQDSKVGIRCSSKGLKVAEMSSFSNQVSLNVTSEVKPFQSLTIQMYVRADLTQLPAAKDSHSIEHRVKLSVYIVCYCQMKRITVFFSADN